MTMDLVLDRALGPGFHSASQKTRVMTEDWAHRNLYCCSCGAVLRAAKANQPVLDLECARCAQGFELKSMAGVLGRRVVDGAYGSMIRRLESASSPAFFFLSYCRTTFVVRDVIAVPPFALDTSSIMQR
jgi:type II restriction enzyme